MPANSVVAHSSSARRRCWPRAVSAPTRRDTFGWRPGIPAGCTWRSRRFSPNRCRPDIRASPSTSSPPRALSRTWRRLRSGDVDMGLALADVAERDRAARPADTAPQAVARVYENYLQVIVRDSAAATTAFRPSGMRVSIGAARIRARRRPARCCSTPPAFAAAWTWPRYRLKDGLARLADGGLDALVWSGGVPTPAIADLDTNCHCGCSTSARWRHR